MTSKVLFPALSEDGWTNSPMKVADYLFSHFLLSDKSQTYLYDDNVSSLPWIIQNTQKDMTRTITDTQTTLSNYFSRYFNDVVVEVSEIPNLEDPSKGQISIYLRFTDNTGEEFVLGRMVHLVDSIISNVVTIING